MRYSEEEEAGERLRKKSEWGRAADERGGKERRTREVKGLGEEKDGRRGKRTGKEKIKEYP